MKIIPIDDSLAIAGDWKIERPHPDPCWIIRNEEETASYSDGAGTVYAFSNEDLAKAYIKVINLAGAIVRRFTWDELVDEFSAIFHSALIDHKGEEGFYEKVPLSKGI